MIQRALTRQRLLAQGLLGPRPVRARDVARGFLASQGQDLPGVISSLALRLDLPPGLAVAEVLRAFAEGEIVRGYPMRGTVFAVAAEDLRWLTQLCAAGEIRQAAARREKHLGLAETEIHRARDVLEAEAGETGLLRSELLARWSELGIATERGHQYHILKHLLMTDVVVYGPVEGRENRVVAADRWLPRGSSLEERFGGDRTEAAAELVRRYFLSRGPATLRDASWFSKLPLRLLMSAFAQVSDEVEEVGPDARGEMRYARPGLRDDAAAQGSRLDRGLLLPPFDEMVLGYPDRLAMMTPAAHDKLVPGNNGIFQRGFLRRGEMVARWKRKPAASGPKLELVPLDASRSLPGVAVKEAHSAFRVFPHYP